MGKTLPDSSRDCALTFDRSPNTKLDSDGLVSSATYLQHDCSTYNVAFRLSEVEQLKAGHNVVIRGAQGNEGAQIWHAKIATDQCQRNKILCYWYYGHDDMPGQLMPGEYLLSTHAQWINKTAVIGRSGIQDVRTYATNAAERCVGLLVHGVEASVQEECMAGIHGSISLKETVIKLPMATKMEISMADQVPTEIDYCTVPKTNAGPVTRRDSSASHAAGVKMVVEEATQRRRAADHSKLGLKSDKGMLSLPAVTARLPSKRYADIIRCYQDIPRTPSAESGCSPSSKDIIEECTMSPSWSTTSSGAIENATQVLRETDLDYLKAMKY